MATDERASPATFELPNGGGGTDPFRLDEVTESTVVVLFQRDYHCRNCRQQATDVERRLDEFTAADALPVSVLPESPERTAEWAASIDASYPILADPDTQVGEAYDQPTRFGVLGSLSDLVGRMPLAVVLDTDGPRVRRRFPGNSPSDRPTIDELLDACRED